MNVAELSRQYEQDGVIRVPALLDRQRIQQVREALARYARDIVPTLPPRDVTFEADGVTVRNLWRLELYDPFFAELAADPRILQLVGALVHGEPVLGAVETFSKPARVGSGVPPHQDNAYFCQTPPDMLTVWIAVDPATLENGPIMYVRGSHKLGTLPHKPSGVRGNSMGLAEPFDHSDPFVGTLDSGDALIHHSQTIHYSLPNRTDQPRCGLLLVYRGKHTQRDEALFGQYAKGGAVAAS